MHQKQDHLISLLILSPPASTFLPLSTSLSSSLPSFFSPLSPTCYLTSQMPPRVSSLPSSPVHTRQLERERKREQARALSVGADILGKARSIILVRCLSSSDVGGPSTLQLSEFDESGCRLVCLVVAPWAFVITKATMMTTLMANAMLLEAQSK